MKLNLPILLLGGVGAFWLYSRSKAEEEDEDGYVFDFPEDFDPSEYEFDEGEFGDYGIFGLSKAERRDSKRRQAARKMKRYRKCVAKKGEEKCAKKLSRAEKKLLKAAALDEKLAAKGKITRIELDASSGQIRSYVGQEMESLPSASGPSGFTPSTVEDFSEEIYTDDEYPDDGSEDTTVETTGPSTAVLALGGLAILGVGGFLIFSLTAKPKRKKKKKPAAKKAAAA